MSQQLTRSDLWSLEQYSTERAAFRAEVLAHKQHRRVPLGRHIMLIFEDVTTIRYQIQEMLRIEKVFEVDAIQEELDAYNPLPVDISEGGRSSRPEVYSASILVHALTGAQASFTTVTHSIRT